jgi:hypothetical protein
MPNLRELVKWMEIPKVHFDATEETSKQNWTMEVQRSGAIHLNRM